MVDDYSQTTPVQKILPCLIRELKETGIEKENLRILVALGTHRPMGEEEMIRKFGAEFCKQYPILNHEWWNPRQLVDLGATKRGTPSWSTGSSRKSISSSASARSFPIAFRGSAGVAISSNPESAVRRPQERPTG